MIAATSWDGFEPDGSDTSFTVSANDLDQARRALLALLEHPLWDGQVPVTFSPPARERTWRVPAPHRFGDPPATGNRFTLAQARSLARDGQLDDHALVLTALAPDRLGGNLLARLASHSARRVPPEPGYLLSPGPLSLGDGEWFAPEVGITLVSQPDLPAVPRLEITLGPTFIYEYAMELVATVRRASPDVAVEGGLDCQGGWTWGCTYASTLYPVTAIHFRGPRREALGRLLAGNLLERPRLPGGYSGVAWYQDTEIGPARDLQFAAAGRWLIGYLEHPAAGALVPDLERFINPAFRE